MFFVLKMLVAVNIFITIIISTIIVNLFILLPLFTMFISINLTSPDLILLNVDGMIKRL